MIVEEMKQQVANTLSEQARDNAINFIEFLVEQEFQFELSTTDYWMNKQYWYVKYQNEFVGFILINGYMPVKDDTEPEGWIFWSDNYNSDLFANYSVDEMTKEITYKHIDFGTCGGGINAKIFGNEFSPVCNGTTLRFDNPSADEIKVMKKLVSIRKLDILNS